ncbi:MAG TPA: 3'(2'),5'-bisphosphate nucleotidase CysQ [Xanthomonadales bacterium]|nr:3'(2'),5'-bisphosphate nucleotidase CysQ [Xanthomonadales bacterium]
MLEEVTEISRLAGHAIMDIYRQGIEVTTKDDDSPLTQADLASHAIILRKLRELTPKTPCLSEEAASIDFATRSGWHEYWLVDPLDGTKEFIKRNGEFTVNIALIREHEPVLGVVHIPVSDETYFGGQGLGAWRIDDQGATSPIKVRRPSADPLVVVGSRSHANPQLEQYLQQLGEHELISMGSSLKFCVVAEGKADFYPRLGPTSEWDTAAAHAVVLAAGGKVLQLDGQPLRYNLKDSLLNPEFLVIADETRDYLDVFSQYSP